MNSLYFIYNWASWWFCWSLKQFRLCYGSILYYTSHLHTKDLVVDRIGCDQSLVNAKKVVVFVHFDRNGVVHDFVKNYLESFIAAGFSILFVSNAPKLQARDVDWLKVRCAGIIRRKNVGYDFGAYKDGIASLPDLQAIETLILANDSVYGPFFDLKNMIDAMSPELSDVWGATDSWEVTFHLQSYFLLFHNRALNAPAFQAFWNKVRYVQSKTWIIQNYEIGLTRAMIRARSRCRAAFPYRALSNALFEAVVDKRILDDTSMDPAQRAFIGGVFHLINAGKPVNATHFFWDFLIRSMRFPFLKRELLQRNPARIPFLLLWERILRESSDYDVDLIKRHLEMSVKNRFI